MFSPHITFLPQYAWILSMIIQLAQRCPSKSATIVHLFNKPGACSPVFCSLLTVVAVLLASAFFGVYPTPPSPFCWKQIFGCSWRGGLATRAQQKTLRRGCVAAKWENLWVRADGGRDHKVSGSARQWISQGCVCPPIYLCSTRRQPPSHLRAFVLESMFVCPGDHSTRSNILF